MNALVSAHALCIGHERPAPTFNSSFLWGTDAPWNCLVQQIGRAWMLGHTHIHWCACMVRALAFGMGASCMLPASLTSPMLSLMLLLELSFTLGLTFLFRIF